MTRAEVETLLGGHATGTLTEAERKALYAAALEDQALFDALMDEEALRELLADPEARAALLAALAPAATVAPSPAPPRVLPLWRRPGVLGAAAGLLMASLAGLTWLRSPQTPAPLRPETAPTKPRSLDLPEAAPTPSKRTPRAPAPPRPERPLRQEAGSPAADQAAAEAAPVPVPAPASAAAPVPAAQDQRQKAAEAPPPAPAAAAVEVRSGLAPEGLRARRAPEDSEPLWTLVPQPDGTTLVTVWAPRSAPVVLLRRGEGGVEVLQGRAMAEAEGRIRREYRVRLKAGDALDLYRLDAPVADPARLPETGPVEGFRARIHPAAK